MTDVADELSVIRNIIQQSLHMTYIISETFLRQLAEQHTDSTKAYMSAEKVNRDSRRGRYRR